ncbi:hypothetical protein CLOM_g19127 [Closterium sp. NIES-68]|nr:hypothetical protein CLOM_g19127 [Closterium sp. NIES-68]GJP59456.1 hypothetical protein CLOP_g12249 [Closterium sp. NIES-67]
MLAVAPTRRHQACGPASQPAVGIDGLYLSGGLQSTAAMSSFGSGPSSAPLLPVDVAPTPTAGTAAPAAPGRISTVEMTSISPVPSVNFPDFEGLTSQKTALPSGAGKSAATRADAPRATAGVRTATGAGTFLRPTPPQSPPLGASSAALGFRQRRRHSFSGFRELSAGSGVDGNQVSLSNKRILDGANNGDIRTTPSPPLPTAPAAAATSPPHAEAMGRRHQSHSTEVAGQRRLVQHWRMRSMEALMEQPALERSVNQGSAGSASSAACSMLGLPCQSHAESMGRRRSVRHRRMRSMEAVMEQPAVERTSPQETLSPPFRRVYTAVQSPYGIRASTAGQQSPHASPHATPHATPNASSPHAGTYSMSSLVSDASSASPSPSAPFPRSSASAPSALSPEPVGSAAASHTAAAAACISGTSKSVIVKAMSATGITTKSTATENADGSLPRMISRMASSLRSSSCDGSRSRRASQSPPLPPRRVSFNKLVLVRTFFD